MGNDTERRRLIAKRDTLAARLHKLDQSAAAEAEAFARNADGLPPSFGRHASDWSRRHERQYQARLADIRAAQRNDRGAIAKKIERQNAALRAQLLRDARAMRHQVNPSISNSR